jgi:hypothetical protein
LLARDHNVDWLLDCTGRVRNQFQRQGTDDYRTRAYGCVRHGDSLLVIAYVGGNRLPSCYNNTSGDRATSGTYSHPNCGPFDLVNNRFTDCGGRPKRVSVQLCAD